MPNAGQRVRAVDFTAPATDTQNAAGTTTSTTYTETLTGGTACGVAFVAPTSGRALIINTTDLLNSGANFTRMSFVVRTGSSIGSGTTVQSAGDSTCLLHIGTTEKRSGWTEIITGLTAGNSYNVRQAFRVSSGTGTFQGKVLTVVPLP